MSSHDRLDSGSCPKARETRSARFWLIARGIAWGVFLGILFFAVPRVEAIFADYNFPLPTQTSLLFRAWHRPFAVVVLLVLIGTDWLALEALSRREKCVFFHAWPALRLICPLLLITWITVVLILPFLTVCRLRLSG
jgi:type II secretory pathway component PulF